MPRKASAKDESPFKGVKMRIKDEYFPVTNCLKKYLGRKMGSDVVRFGLYKGDIVNTEPVTELNETSVYVWDMLDSATREPKKTLFVGSMYWNFGDFYINGEKFDQWKVVCLGVIVSVTRKYNASEHLPQAFAEVEEPKDTEEITAVCDDCGKTISGNLAFLKGMYWKIKKDYAECPACR